ncbi:MAG: 2-oxo acid dehydrogenase subunit E2 [Chloroflexota bacterium]|nr:2-oxo acid dehydrogenase subunit E2 [Chloroflexota bacterium]
MTSTDYLLPPLPFGSAEYTIVRWLKRAGDAVDAGEPLLVVANDRVEAALPAACVGMLERILAVEGTTVAAGVQVATIVASTAAHSGDLSDSAQSTVRISPVARRIANSTKVDITQLQGTGVSGRIMKIDVLAALPDQTPQTEARLDAASPIHNSPLSYACPPSPISHLPSPIPYVLTVIDVDLERVALAIAQRGPSFARRRLELSYRVCIALAVVAALPAHPLLNGYWANSMIVTRRRVHLAVVACDGASIRCVCDAQDLNLRGLARRIGGAAAEADSEARTFTIAELGDHVWGDPAALAGAGTAALGIGAVRACPLVIDDDGMDRLAVRRAALLTLAYDARVLDQYQADAFLRDVKSRLEQFHV